MSDMYSVIETGDGSSTVKSEEFGEAMHTDAGAYEESVVKHVRACGKIREGSGHLSILDVGFGIGYNLCALLVEWSRLPEKPFLDIVSLEKDNSVSECLSKLYFGDERDVWFEVVKNAFLKGELEGDGYSISIRFGDARRTVLSLVEQHRLFDVVFQDAFSPAKNPELWSLDYFRRIRQIMKNDAILTTYSAAPQIRRAMSEAGLRIAKGVSTGKKKEGTLASPSVLNGSMTQDEMRTLFDEIKSIPYRDESLESDRETSLTRRIEEMAVIREDRRDSLCRQAPLE